MNYLPPPTMSDIATCVVRLLGVRYEQLVGRGRHARVVAARAVCVYLAREMTALSYPEIARAFGRKNHSTALSSFKWLEAHKADPAPVWPHMDTNLATIQDIVDRARRDIDQRVAERRGG